MIVIHEAGGLNEHIRDVANRFANLGYVRARRRPVHARRRPAADGRHAGDDGAPVRDVRRDRARRPGGRGRPPARARGRRAGKIGCIGFCMGGRYTLLFACASDRLDAAVDCWGGLHRQRHARGALDPRAPDAAAGAGRASQLPAAGGGRRRGPEPLAGARRGSCASARAGERPGGQGRRLRGRRATRSSPTTAPPTGPARPRSCGRRSCRSSPAPAAAADRRRRRALAGPHAAASGSIGGPFI